MRAPRAYRLCCFTATRIESGSWWIKFHQIMPLGDEDYIEGLEQGSETKASVRDNPRMTSLSAAKGSLQGCE
jgi:hypothetical protein